ncbi:hypothetical protein GCG21_08955 [Pseudactinotalea sp. HY160]|uniref:hypothetical protein n=1 Tax=Pseudactinotalea sp. HY160 TaxID=2654490 RepID=UPI00128D5724|nr:hypothetical protein [Pseudactinotalea sp. HY160]MPV50131.1 hypothetical protein [Pseudactinotalea sp. HY160]
MNVTATSPSQTADAHGGYRLTKFKQMAGGRAFEGDISRDGRKVGSLRQSGNGGVTHFMFGDPAERARFMSAAAEKYPDAFEPDEDLAGRLAQVADLNRKRSWLIQLDSGEDFFDLDPCDAYVHTMSPEVPREAVLWELSRWTYDGRHARLWDRDRGVFVPIGEVDD